MLHLIDYLTQYADKLTQGISNPQPIRDLIKEIANGAEFSPYAILKLVLNIQPISHSESEYSRLILSLFDFRELLGPNDTKRLERFHSLFTILYDKKNNILLSELVACHQGDCPNDMPVYEMLINHSLYEVLANLLENKIIAISFLEVLIEALLKKGNIAAILDIRKNFDKFDFYQTAFSPTLQNELIKIFSYPAPEFLNKLLLEFKKSDSIDFQGVCLTAARIKVNYPTFNVTVLNIQPHSEFAEYLSNCKKHYENNRLPLQERFIMTGAHWLAGEIRIDEENSVSIILTDSLPLSQISEMLAPSVYLTIYVIREFCNIFDAFQRKIYLPNVPRQGKTRNCRLFTIDDMESLFKIPDYLPQNVTLLDYLNKNTTEIHEKTYKTGFLSTKQQIHFSNFPLRFMRPTESKKLFYIIDNSDKAEQQRPINRKGLTAKNATKLDFKAIDDVKVLNKRLDEKLQKIVSHNYRYMITRTQEEIEKDMSQFTLAAFIKRLSIADIEHKEYDSNDVKNRSQETPNLF